MEMKVELFLENFFIKEGMRRKEFTLLSEDNKNKLNEELIKRLYQSSIVKSSNLDYDEILKSKGDINNYKHIHYINDSISLIKGIQIKLNQNIKELYIIENSLKHMNDLKNDFEQGFRIESEIVISLYCNLVVAIIGSVSFIISSMLDYIQDPNTGNFEINFTSEINKFKTNKNYYGIVFLKSLESFNKSVLNGDIHRMFEALYSKKSLIGTITTSQLGILVGITVAIFIVPIIREIIYQYNHMRVSLSDYLNLQATFIEMNRVRLEGSKDMKKTKEKQEKIAKTLHKLADKVNVDVKTSSKKAEMELKKEDKNLTISNLTKNRVNFKPESNIESELLL